MIFKPFFLTSKNELALFIDWLKLVLNFILTDAKNLWLVA